MADSTGADSIASTQATSLSPHPRKRVFIVRHGERADQVQSMSEWIGKVDGRRFDPPLTEEGLCQAERAAKFLFRRAIPVRVHSDIAAVYSSALLRCLETAAQIAKVCCSRCLGNPS
jgi:broad specificity phosphatase PhoE